MKQLAKGSGILTITSVGEMVMRFVRTKCIALFLGTAGTGFLAQLALFFETLRVMADLGSRRAVIKQIAEERPKGKDTERYAEVVNTSYILVLISSFLTALAVSFYSPALSRSLYGDASHYPYLVLVAFMLPVAALSTVTASIMKGNLDYKPYAKYTLAAHVAVILVSPFLIYFFRYWGGIVVQGLFFAVPLAAYLVFNSRRKFLKFSNRVNWSALKEQLFYGSSQIYHEAAALLTRLVIAAWIIKDLGLSAMGIYQVAITFSTIYLTIPMQAMNGYTYPVIAASQTSKEIMRAVNESLRFLLFLLTPVLVILTLWPKLLIALFFSREFTAAAPVLQIQLLSTFFILVMFPFACCLDARGKLKAILVTGTLNSFLFFVLSWLFIDAWKLEGVASAFSIAAFVNAPMQYFLAHRYFGVRLLPKNQRLLTASALWMLLAFLTGKFFPLWIFQFSAFLLGIPWFLWSSKDHERQFVAEKCDTLLKTVRKEIRFAVRQT